MAGKGIAPQVRAAFVQLRDKEKKEIPTTLDLWRVTRIEKKALLKTLWRLARSEEIESLDEAPGVGFMHEVSAHDDRRWRIKPAQVTA